MKPSIAAGLALWALSGCATGPQAPPPGTPYVEVYSGGTFSGSNTTRVYEGDILYAASTEPFSDGPGGRFSQGRPGVWAEVSALVAREGPRVVPETAPEDYACMDYGVDRVEAVPPLGRFQSVGASCPDAAVAEFIGAVLRAIPGDPV